MSVYVQVDDCANFDIECCGGSTIAITGTHINRQVNVELIYIGEIPCTRHSGTTIVTEDHAATLLHQLVLDNAVRLA